MHPRPRSLGLAIAAALGFSAAAKATTYPATLQSQVSYSPNGSSSANLTSSTATWQYDDATGVFSQTSGTFNTRFVTAPTNTLFRHVTTGLVVGAGAAAVATTYECQEGNFGSFVGASICGNYRFGSNAVDDSTVTWGPGTATGRTLGGDDMALGPQQSIVAYDGFTQQSVAGNTIVLSNATCVSTQFFDCNADPGFLNTGYDLTLTVRGAGPDSASTEFNTPTAPIDILANDRGFTDPVTVTITTPPDAGGTVAITSAGADCADPCFGSQADIRVALTPSAPPGTATYTETFTYQVDDGASPPGTANVTVTVNGDPDTDTDAGTDSGQRNGSGGSATDVVLLSLLFGGALVRRRRG